MIYDHVVKANGTYYSAGTDVPEMSAPIEPEIPFSDSEIMLETEPVKRGRPKKN